MWHSMCHFTWHIFWHSILHFMLTFYLTSYWTVYAHFLLAHFLDIRSGIICQHSKWHIPWNDFLYCLFTDILSDILIYIYVCVCARVVIILHFIYRDPHLVSGETTWTNIVSAWTQGTTTCCHVLVIFNADVIQHVLVTRHPWNGKSRCIFLAQNLACHQLPFKI